MHPLTVPVVLTEEEQRYLRWLRKALRKHRVADSEILIHGEPLPSGWGADEFHLYKSGNQWVVAYMERGQYHNAKSYFDRVSDACHFAFWRLTRRDSPLNYKLDE